MNQKKISVLMDCQVLTLQKYGGVSRYFSTIFRLIKKNKNTDIQIPAVYSCNGYFTDDEYHIKEFPKGKWRIRFYKLINYFDTILVFMINRNKYDIYHPTYYNPFLFLFVSNDMKVVVTVHDMIHEIFSKTHADAKKTIKWKRKCLERADHIIAVSNNTKHDIIHFFPEIDKNKISVIYHGSPLNNSKEKVNDLPNKYVLYVGTRNQYKNFGIMIKAMNSIMCEYKDLYFVCVGGGKLEQHERTQIAHNDRLKHYSCNDNELNYIYSNAVCLVFPSLYEGFGIPILEAFDNGCPVILSNASCFPEIAKDAALYFAPNDYKQLVECIKTFITDDNKRKEYISRGLERIKNFDWNNAAKQTIDIYENVVCEN